MNTIIPSQNSGSAHSTASQLSISWRTIAILLLVIIAVMAYLWKPWTSSATARRITVQGQATVSATPDKYDFQPVFQNASLKAVTATGNEALTQLKKLGVKDNDIKTSISVAGDTKPSDGREILIYPRPTKAISTYYITATLSDKSLAQKVSNYLATTTATGQVTPAVTFSKVTSDKLELEARAKASENARSKATVSAKELSARVGKVTKISDGGYGLYARDGAAESSASAQSAQPAVSGPKFSPVPMK